MPTSSRPDDRDVHQGASSSLFADLANRAAHETGRAHTFVLALLGVLGWALTGPLFGFSDSWQLFINTGTTIVTFLMVFLIQCSQNRDTQALQLKLDELILATKGARNTMTDLEDRSEDELRRLKSAMTTRGGDDGTS